MPTRYCRHPDSPFAEPGQLRLVVGLELQAYAVRKGAQQYPLLRFDSLPQTRTDPPATSTTMPLIQEELFVARNSAAFATSSGVPRRRMG